MLLFFEDTGSAISSLEFWKQALPLTLIAIAALTLLYFFRDLVSFDIVMVLLFFISVLTLPHIFIVEKMYKKEKSMAHLKV
jgi:hypothetical protein